MDDRDYREEYRQICDWLGVNDSHAAVAFEIGTLMGKSMKLKAIEEGRERVVGKPPALGAPYGELQPKTLRDHIADIVYCGVTVYENAREHAHADRRVGPSAAAVSDTLDAVVRLAKAELDG